MNHPTDNFVSPRATAEEAQQFRGAGRQIPGPQPGPESDRSLGLREDLAHQALMHGGPEGQRAMSNGSELPGRRDLPPLVEPVYDPGLEFPVEALADHPLLRGLLMELPPRGGQPPSPEWLDRWFEATRSILELLYNQGSYKMGV